MKMNMNMKIDISNKINKQKGAVTLFTSVILLVAITLVSILTAKTVLQETKMAANNYRAAQAVSAANAALDYALAYFDDGGFDHDLSGAPDVLVFPALSSGATAIIIFNNAVGTRCVTAGTADMKKGLVTVTGRSDDGLGRRTISQCVGSIDLFGGNAPKQPLVAKGAVGLTGNYKIINRYNNTTIWSGETATIGMSASASTYLRKQNLEITDLTQAELEDDDTSNAYTSAAITDRDKGTGVDTIDKDPGLANLSGDGFFNNFFFDDKTTVASMASYSTVAGAEGAGVDAKGGVVWVEGDSSMNGGTYGAPGKPVVIIINGDFDVSGNPNIYGLLYVVGQMNASGTPTVFGSVLVEGEGVPAGEEPVTGNGTVNLIYTPSTLDQAPNPLSGTTTAVAGSWRDWD